MKKIFIFGFVGLFVMGITQQTFAQAPVAADASALASIQFPVKELGNCKNQAACRAYCDNSSYIKECVEFGREHGLMTEEQAMMAEKYADVLAGQGPGGCKDEKTCRAYCADLSHADECLTFAEKYGLLSVPDLVQAKQVAKALRDGASMPGGCKDKDSCEAYCDDSAHADECLAFAEKAGLMSASDIAEAKKFLPLIKEGKMPGGCKNRTACEAYCKDDAHFSECVAFAESTGLISKEDAEIAKKVGGSGPGGCRSKAACEAYCNDSDHTQECFAFAKGKGILPAEKIKEIEDGMARLRMGMSQAPGEVVACLKEKLGSQTVGRIESGTLTPSLALGETVKTCFATFMPKVKEKMQQALSIATPEVKKCLEDKVGQENLNKIMNGEAPSPDAGDKVQACFAVMKEEGVKKLQDAMKQVPTEVRTCVQNKLGANIEEQIKNSEDSSIGVKIENAFKDCSKEFQGKMQQKIQSGLSQIPPEAKTCLEQKLGGSLEDKISSGAVDPSRIQALVGECMATNTPTGMPGTNGQIPSGTEIPEGQRMAPPAGMMDAACANFASVPDCSYVPAQFQEMCRQCKK